MEPGTIHVFVFRTYVLPHAYVRQHLSQPDIAIFDGLNRVFRSDPQKLKKPGQEEHRAAHKGKERVQQSQVRR